MARILVLCHRLPFPPDKGDKIRAYHIVRRLARDHDVRLAALADAPDDAAAPLPPCLRPEQVACAVRTPVQRAAGLAWAALRGAPLSVGLFRSPVIAAWMQDQMRQRRPDLVFVYSSAMAQYAPAGIPAVIDYVDADPAKWRAYAENARGPMRAVYARETRALERFDAEAAAAADLCLFVAPQERDLFLRYAADARDKSRVIPNGVDTAAFAPAQDDGEEPNTAVFVGMMDYRPNVDAACWFADEILPLVRRAVPHARLVIVGANPAASVRALARRPGIAVTGRVPDVRPYLARGSVAVAPLRIARGIQNKVLEAMACARPVVATPQAAEGIAAEPGRDILIGNDAASFAAHVVAAMRGAHGALGPAARAAVIAHHGWERHLDTLSAAVSEVLAGHVSRAPG